MSLFYGQSKKNNQASLQQEAKQKMIQYAKDNPDIFAKAMKDYMAGGNKNKESQGFGRSSVLLPNQNGDGWCSKLCACAKLEFYKQYFEVTNGQVIQRIGQSIKWWEGKFFQPRDQQYDFYGTFWIYTTIIFCISAVQNIIRYQTLSDFSFNFDIIGASFGFFYVFGFGFPVILSFSMKFLGIQNKPIQILSLYGYASAIYIPIILLCSLNICILHWALIAYAAFSRGMCILRNITSGFEIPTNRKLLIAAAVVLESLVVFGAVKLIFIHCMSNQTKASQPAHFHQHNIFLKLRNY